MRKKGTDEVIAELDSRVDEIYSQVDHAQQTIISIKSGGDVEVDVEVIDELADDVERLDQSADKCFAELEELYDKLSAAQEKLSENGKDETDEFATLDAQIEQVRVLMEQVDDLTDDIGMLLDDIECISEGDDDDDDEELDDEDEDDQ